MVNRIPIAVCLTDTHLKEGNFEENFQVYKAAVEYCKSIGHSTIYHLADIFNSRKSQSEEVLNNFHEILEYLEREEITLFTFPGNHDRTSYGSIKSFLRPFSKHPSFILKEEGYDFRLNDDFIFYFIPFFSDDVYRTQLQKLQELSYDSWVKTHSKAKHLLFTHIGFSGARMNSGLIVDGIKPSEVAMFDKVFVGHFHDKQNVGENIHYIGSSIQHNFGETPDKGLTVIYNDLSFETVEIPTKRYLTLEVDVLKLEASDIQEITKVSSESKDNLRIVLFGPEEQVKSFNKQQLMVHGVSVETKVDKLEKKEIEERVEPFTALTLVSSFEGFCEQKNLDVNVGKKYLSQVI